MEFRKALLSSSSSSSSSSSRGYSYCYSRALSFNLHHNPSSSLSIPVGQTKLGRPTTLHHQYYRRPLIPATKSKSSPSNSDDNDSSPILPKKKSPLTVFWEFVVPYVLIGFAILYISRAARVFVNNRTLLLDHLLSSPALAIKLLSGLVCLICCNMFTVAINQVYDIEIDKINKPYKPLASGDMSVKTAWGLITSYLVITLGILAANKAEPWVVLTYCVNLLILTTYSVPPIRFKRIPILAPFMLALTHITGNFGIYRALKATLPFLEIHWAPAFAYIAIFHAIFFFVLGILKDIPDIEGDRKHGVFTPAAALGPRTTTFLGSGILLLLYMVAIGSGAVLYQSFNSLIMIPSHFVMAVVLVYRVWQLDKSKYAPNECEVFYRFLWSLLYLENFLFPFI